MTYPIKPKRRMYEYLGQSLSSEEIALLELMAETSRCFEPTTSQGRRKANLTAIKTIEATLDRIEDVKDEAEGVGASPFGFGRR